MTPLFDLTGTVCVVTGGGRGIGRALAEGMATQGARVVICGRTRATLMDTVEQCQANGADVSFVVADVSDERAVEELKATVLESHGRIDVLVNNAGINPYYDSAENTTLAQWQDIINVNLTGVYLCSRTIGTDMLRQGRGSIINITSIAGRVGLPKSAAYCAAKGGVEMMSRSMALDWATRGVRVNTVAPGYVSSDLTQGLEAHPVLSERLKANTPLGRFGKACEIVGAVIYLASDASGFVTGQTIGVDGGWTAA